MKRLPLFRYPVALSLLLALLIYDGAIRKWLLPNAEQLVFVAKDALLVLTLLVYLFSQRRKRRSSTMPPTVRLCIVLYSWWVILEIFNPNLPNLLVGIWGAKSHLLYAGLIILLPVAYPRLDEFFDLLEGMFPWLVIPVAALAFAQVLAPFDSILNQQVTGTDAGLAFFGESGLVRVSGPFSYISGMAGFVQITCLLGVALYLGGARSRMFLVGLGFALASLPVTGSRAVVAVVAVGAILIIGAALAARLIGTVTVFRAGLVIMFLGGISLYSQDAAWEALTQRALNHREDENRSITAFTNAFEYLGIAGFTGFGAGSTNFGSVALAGDVDPFSWLPNSIGFEEESGRIVLELGVVGWLLSLAMRVSLLLWAVTLFLGSRSRAARLAGVVAFPLMALGVQQGNGVFAVPLANVYYWFCVALMAMARFQEKQLRAEQAHAIKEQWQALIPR
jgi:hypothetical protein